jgi:putative transposase
MFHLIVQPVGNTIPTLLRQLKPRFSRTVIERWRELDAAILDRLIDSQGRHRFWQPGGGYDRNINTERRLREKIEYLHANPVRRGLCETPTDWPWSSARWYQGEHGGPVRIDPISMTR